MRINAKIMLLVAAGLVFTSVVIGFLAVWQLNRSGNMAVARIEQLRPEYLKRIKADGKSQVEAFRAEMIAHKKDDIDTLVAGRKAKIAKSVADATDEMGRQIESIKTEIHANIKRVLWLISLVTLIVLALIQAVSYFFAQASITRPIKQIIDRLSGGADQVASASGQITSASQSLAGGSSEQAASIEESSASLDEMAAMTKQNADNASQADQLMRQAREVVDRANESMAGLTASMEDISTSSEETSKIIKTIDEIAFQTNLLALNAAVEAARAGEAGAGFAVVADEVRNLAMRAADAAKETATLIEGTTQKVKTGSDLVAGTNEAFAQVTDSASRVGDLVAEIAAASDEQARGIEQVNIAVTEMDKVTQQNAANAQQSASSSEQMLTQAGWMKEMVTELVSLVGGSDSGTKERSSKTEPSLREKIRNKIVPSNKNDYHNEMAPPREEETRPEQLIPLEDDDFKDF